MDDRDEVKRIIRNHKKINFESTADDMKRIVEYANKKNTQGLKHRGSMNSIASLRVIQEPQHRFELSVDGIREVFDGSLEEAYKRLTKLSINTKFI